MNLRSKAAAALQAAQSIKDSAVAAERDLTAEEVTQIEAYISESERLLAEAEKADAAAKKLADASAKLAQPLPRRVAPDAIVARRIEPVNPPAGQGGFRSFGEFATAVRASVSGSGVDARLLQNAAAGAPAQEGVGADGGYLVPADFRQELVSRVLGEESLLSRCHSIPTASNAITFPVEDDQPWDTSKGIQAYWEGEGAPYKSSRPALSVSMLRLNKLTALVPVTDELLEDGAAIAAYLQRKTPEKMLFKINDAIMRGDGVGKPRGLLNSPCLVTEKKEAAQAPGSIVFANISKMFARMPEANRRNSVWLMNPDLEPQLDTLAFPNASGGAVVPAYFPPGGLSERGYATLKGRPVLFSQAASPVGTTGDIMLVDFSCYFAPVKSSGLRTDVSIHLWFDQGLTAFRFTWRLGGQSWWASPITRPGSKNSQSCFVALEGREGA